MLPPSQEAELRDLLQRNQADLCRHQEIIEAYEAEKAFRRMQLFADEMIRHLGRGMAGLTAFCNSLGNLNRILHGIDPAKSGDDRSVMTPVIVGDSPASYHVDEILEVPMIPVNPHLEPFLAPKLVHRIDPPVEPVAFLDAHPSLEILETLNKSSKNQE